MHKLFLRHSDFYSGCGGKVNLGAPTLRPFMVVKKELDWLSAKRNPYYCKIDIIGNQLPYIDKVFVTTASNREVVNIMKLNAHHLEQFFFKKELE